MASTIMASITGWETSNASFGGVALSIELMVVRAGTKAALAINTGGKEELLPMGNKIMSKLLAVFVAAAVLMTSALGVFAAASPELGASNLTETFGKYKAGTMDVSYTPVEGAESYNILVNGVVKANVKGTSVQLTGMQKNALYDIQIQAVKGNKTGKASAVVAKTLSKRWFKNITKVKYKKGKKKVKVSWKKVKGATGYQVLYSKDGKTWKTKFVKGGKKTKVTIKKLKKGKWKFSVRAVKGDYLGIRSNIKTVKVK